MRKRTQRRRKAVLPLKIFIDASRQSLLAHTLDISASGARLIVPANLAPGTILSLEYKHRRTSGMVVWSRSLKGSKYDHELGIHLPRPASSYWGIALPTQELDLSDDVQVLPFAKVMSVLMKEG